MASKSCGLLLNLLIVSALAAANRDTAVPGTHSVEILHCDFGEAADANYDLWPDGWTRLRGPGYPQYVKVGIVEAPVAPQSVAPPPAESVAPVLSCLKIELDGGGAFVSSPPIPVAPRFSYCAEANVRTSGLKHDFSSLTLTFLDEQRNVLEEIESPRLTGTTSWTALRIGPVAPTSEQARFAVLNWRVQPQDREDLRGEAFLADVRLSRLPQLTLRAGGVQHLYFAGEPIEVTADLSGMSANDNQVVFELLDPYGKVLTQTKQALVVKALPLAGGDAKTSLSATSTWQPPVPGPGFYRVNAVMVGENGLSLQRSISLAVIEHRNSPLRGDFGWTLPEGERPLDFGPLTTILAQAGVSWLKFPTWYDEKDQARADRLAWFAERIGQSGIEMVGLLDQPPASQRQLFGATTRLPIALIFTDREVWQPAIDPLMMRLALKVHWWQLGSDDDASYMGTPDLPAKIAELKQSFDRYGQENKLALVWQAAQPAPTGGLAPGSVLSYTDQIPATADQPAVSLTAEQIQQQFGGNAAAGKRWLSLNPLPQQGHATAERVVNLLQRMIAAKASGIDVTFVPHPFDDDVGLFNADGTPGELFLPWRATTLAISGREYLGDLPLPRGSTNHVFAGKQEASMVVWNERAVREHAFLGHNVRRVDLWGRESALPIETIDGIRQQVIEVGPEPIILTGINAGIVRWCLGFAFAKPTLESVFGREQSVAYHFRNPYDQLVTGEMTLTSPGLWDTALNPQRFRLAAKEERRDSFPLLLKADADSGPQKVRIDFTVVADDEFRFSVYRTLTVGLDDITVDLESNLDESGDLIVKAHVTNRTSKTVTFRATLFAPDRRRQQTVLEIPAPERATAVYRLPNGKDLLGKDLGQRLEELGGSRVLNNHMKAQE